MMRGAMEQGLVNCMASMASVVDEARAHLGDPVDTVFYEPFKNLTGEKVFVQLTLQQVFVQLTLQDLTLHPNCSKLYKLRQGLQSSYQFSLDLRT